MNYKISLQTEKKWLKVVQWAQKNRIKVEEISTAEIVEALKNERLKFN